MNKLQWNWIQNTKLFIHKNAFENFICKMAAILSREKLVNSMLSTFALTSVSIPFIYETVPADGQAPLGVK